MCGIVGYVGTPAAADREYTALDVILEGLRRLEYRGYDSAGVAVIADGRIEARKKAGKVSQLDAELAAHPLPDAVNGIGHTRWATHGGPTDVNAHPHVVADGRLAVVHNGIIENFSELRTELTGKGYEFVSETDTEVAATLLAEIYAHEADEDLTRAMQLTCQRLEGAFTLLAVHADLLLIGIGRDLDRCGAGGFHHGIAVAQVDAAVHGPPGHGAVHGTGVQVAQVQPAGDLLGDRGLAGPGRADDRDRFTRGDRQSEIVQRGDIDHARMVGSWAGAMGQTQFLPSSYLAFAVDADGDGRRDIWASMADVLSSTANFLARSGWQAGEPWGAEVRLPAGFDPARADADLRQVARDRLHPRRPSPA